MLRIHVRNGAMAHLLGLLNCGIRCSKPAWAQTGYCTLNKIPIGMGISLLDGAGRACHGCLLCAIEVLIERASHYQINSKNATRTHRHTCNGD